MTNDAVAQIKALASEHFDSYLIIVSKDGNVWHHDSGKCTAYGMASMIIQDIKDDWKTSRRENIEDA